MRRRNGLNCLLNEMNIRGRVARKGLVIACAVLAGILAQTGVPGGCAGAAQTNGLAQGFANPPNSARLRAYWWWLNGNVTKAAITRDLEEMKAKGFGGALICDAGGADQDGNDRVPHGPTFFTPEWRELYKHALREADRLGLEMSLNIQSGWNLGGPMVKAEDAAKKLTWSEARVNRPGEVRSGVADAQDPRRASIATSPWSLIGSQVPRLQLRHIRPTGPSRTGRRRRCIKPLSFSAPDTAPLFQEFPAVAGRGGHPRGGGVGPDGQALKGRHAALGRAGRHVADSPLRLHHRRPLLRLDVQRRLARLRSGRAGCGRIPPLLGRRGRTAHRRCRAAGGAHAQVSPHGQLGGRAAQLDAHAARGVSQAPRL